ncbi:glycine cleavage system aminomethyltransferase GcvT [Ruminococcaceae bacterium OttesenSCG-928-I18]|nr:glycine cleavage system aminomethyltransferase GcvT [Ruminococcaceae bacterium OttesenSCG-928-I18]
MDQSGADKKTPLYEKHLAAGGKMVPFAGYQLPVQYVGVIEEHMAVRQKAGLFDVSHMGEVLIEGPDALANLMNLYTNAFMKLADGRVRYSPMCNEQGGTVDDLLIYRFDENHYLVVVNAANREKDVAWMKEHLFGDAKLTDQSDDYAQIALQGPLSREILAKVCSETDIPEKYYSFTKDVQVAGVPCLLSQTGYTGEHGYELYCKPEDAGTLWDALLAAGKPEGLMPCGLGARDTLRLEAAMPLYGHEMDEEITPLETGLDFAVKMTKEDFIGKKALVERGEPKIARIGLKMTGRGIAREHNEVYLDGSKIGHTTSGTHCPYLGGAYAMALVDKNHTEVGTELEVEIRGKKVSAEIVPLPFYKHS